MRGGGTGSDAGSSVAIAGQRVCMSGSFTPPATFGSTTLIGPTSGDFFPVLARLDDAALTPLATRASTAGTPLALYPNPASGAATLRGAQPGAAVQVLDALGRVVATALADAGGSAVVGVGLAPGVYVVRTGAATLRLVVR